MIIPSIDIMGGQAVQLVGGKKQVLSAGDPMTVADRFAVAGELAVIDIDAALGQGSNRAALKEIVQRYPCRVGGGIRSVESALEWLDAGARKVILGTAATPDILEQLPRHRVMAALDGVDGHLVVEGWQKNAGTTVLSRLSEIRHLVGGFLVTFVESEGLLGGIDLKGVEKVITASGGTPVTVAGGVTTTEELAAIDRLGADAQVGMALYTHRLSLAEAFAAPLVSDRPDGLWPTVISDVHGRALGLAYSNAESLGAAMDQRRGIYWSRSRGLWKKGATSGAFQELLQVDADCDRDTLRFTVRQHGPGFCHLNRPNCWSEDRGLPRLERRLRLQIANGEENSYTARLASDPNLLAAKIQEEAEELATAVTRDEIVWESADLLYFTLTRLAAGGVSLAEVEAELDRRELTTRRRDGSRTFAKGRMK